MNYIGVDVYNKTIGINLDQISAVIYDKSTKDIIISVGNSPLVTIPDEDCNIYNTIADIVKIGHVNV